MGLTMGERKMGIIRSVAKIVEFGEKTKLKPLVKDLWYGLLSNESTASFWILGGDTCRDVSLPGSKLDCGLWTTAIYDHLYNALGSLETIDEIESEYDHIEEKFSIGELLHDRGNRYGEDSEHGPDQLENIFKTFQWTEQFLYYFNRYDDEMPAQMKGLGSLVNRIQGECYCAFRDEDMFARAYQINLIMKRFIFHEAFPYQEDSWDSLTKWIVKNHVYVDMDRCMEMSVEDLAKIHHSLNQNPSLKNRVVCLGKLMLRRLHKYNKDKFLKKYISKQMFNDAAKMYDRHDNLPAKESTSSIYCAQGYYREKDNGGIK